MGDSEWVSAGVKQSKHLRPRAKYSRTQLISSIERAARRLSRQADRAEVEIGEAGCAMSLRAFEVGLRDLSDYMGERRMTIRPGSRRKVTGSRISAARSQDSMEGIDPMYDPEAF